MRYEYKEYLPMLDELYNDWLDRYKINGNGYCCHVERSSSQSSKVRRPEMMRCELYEAGDWKNRWMEIPE